MILFISYILLIQTNYLSDVFFNLGYEAYQKVNVTLNREQQENVKTADKYLSWSVQLDPNNFKKAYYYADNLNTIFSDLDPDKLKARDLFKKAILLNPNSDTVAFKIGHLYFQGVKEEYQNIDSALKYFNKAIELNKDYFAAIDRRVVIYQTKLFKYPEAIKDLKHLIAIYETKTSEGERWQPSWQKESPKQILYDRLNYCYEDLRAINNKFNELANHYIPECSDMDSYRLGYSYASDQLGGGLLADCDYLYRIAVTQREHVDHSCFCKGVSKWLSDNHRSF